MKSTTIGMLKLAISLLITCVFAATSGVASAASITFAIADPGGDNFGVIDLIGVEMTFDNSTGSYTITATATAANPFNGLFNLNLNLFNPAADGGVGAADPDFFQGTTLFNLASPQTTVTGSGTNARLTFLDVGDIVAYSTGPFGNPTTGTSLFRSNVAQLSPNLNSDFFGLGNGSTAATDFVTLRAGVPEPATFGLVGLGLTMLILKKRIRKVQ